MGCVDDVYFGIKVHLVRAMVFPVVMYGYESWTVKKADAEKLPEVTGTSRWNPGFPAATQERP